MKTLFILLFSIFLLASLAVAQSDDGNPFDSATAARRHHHRHHHHHRQSSQPH